MRFFRSKKRKHHMDENPFGTFKYKDLKELQEVFDNVPKGFVEMVYDLFYFACVGVVATAGTPQFDEMMGAFHEFLGECENSAVKRVAEEETLLEKWKSENFKVGPNSPTMH